MRIKFPFSAGERSSSTKLPVPNQLTSAFVVFCSLTNEYRYPESRWKSFAEEWVERQTTTPLGPAIAECLKTSTATVEVKRMADIQGIADEVKRSYPSEEIAARIDSASHGLLIKARDDLRYPRPGLWTAYSIARGLMEKVHGLAWDTEAKLVQEKVPFPQLHIGGTPRLRHFVSVVSRSNKPGLQRFATCGLTRFGIPELELQSEFPITDTLISEFLWGVAQKLATEAMALVGAAGSASYRLRLPTELVLSADEPWIDTSQRDPLSSPPEGELPMRLRPQTRPDKTNVLVIRPPRDYPGDSRAWIDAAVQLVTGVPRAVESSAPLLPPVDSSDLADLRREFTDGADEPPYVALRYRAATPYGPGYRWLVVSSWLTKRVRGHSVSDPSEAPDYLAGRIIEIDERDIVEIQRKSAARR